MTLQFSHVGGDCLGPEWHGALAIIDPDFPIVSGDLVRIGFVLGGTTHYVIKELREHAGRWYAACREGIVPIAPYALVPDEVARVIARQPFGRAPPPVPESLRATARDREVCERLTAAARAHWAEHGVTTGMPWPGLDAVVGPRPPSHRIDAGERAVVHASLPSTNPTMPSEPVDFNVSVIGGTIVFDWDEPSVVPAGTTYRLLSYVGSLSDAASKLLEWEGATLNAALQFSVNSLKYWQVQARAGSYFSGYSPATYGLGIAPAYVAATAPSGWSASIAPTFLSKISAGGGNKVTDPCYATVVGSVTPVFSWTNPGSVNIRIDSPGAAYTTFTGSGLALYESRSGVFWCNIVDGANTSSKSVTVWVERENAA